MSRPLAGYGTSAPENGGVISRESSPPKSDALSRQSGQKTRRDSAAPLMHTPPIGMNINRTARGEPVIVSPLHNNDSVMPSDLQQMSGGSFGDRSGLGLHRRRRNVQDGIEEESDESTAGELNTSDEEMDSDFSYHNDDDDDGKDTVRRPIMQPPDQVRVHGLSPVCDLRSQRLLIEEEMEVVIEGYRYDRLQLFLYQLLSVLSLGIVWLICRWMPHWWIAWVGNRVQLKDAQWLVILNQYGQRDIVRPVHEFFAGTIGSIFSVDQIKEFLEHSPVEGDNSRFYDMEEKLPHLILVEYRYVRLAFHPLLQKFLIVGYWKDAKWTSVKMAKTGLTTEKYQQRMCAFGPNMINIAEKPIGALLRDEVLNPFYVFQIGSIILWSLDDYYYYAFCIFLISAVSIISTLIETKTTMKRMRDLSRFECSVRTFRNGAWRTVSSLELVPGDLIDIADLHIIPCDAMLIDGDCIVNESMLTGESVPVSKIPVSDVIIRKVCLSKPQIPAEMAKYFLFMGTKVVRVRCGAGVSAATATVVRTGFNTSKGALVRSMLFPKPNNFQFYRDSFRFIGVLSIIAFAGFLISSINFIRLGIDKVTMLLRALDLITIVVPPALPATMSIGTSFAISRLKKIGIFCISPPRVNIGGKIDCMCFDKTGTLTEDGLDIHGFRAIVSHKDGKRFDKEIQSLDGVDPNEDTPNSTKPMILRSMTTCHSLKIVGGELIGDPLDLKMFEFTGWELEESGGASSSGLKFQSELTAAHAKKSAKVGIMPTVVRPAGGARNNSPWQLDNSSVPPTEFGIIHTFEFVSALRRMSVIIRQLAKPHMEVFVKGAPEVMMDICTPDSIPEDYHEQLYWYTHRGYRVIACASRQLVGVKWHKLHKLKRQEVESNLTFLGFIIFENKLKPGTIPAVTTLRNANIRQIMCTGDNILTAISVSRDCGLVDQGAEIYIPKFLSGSSTEPDAQIEWQSVLREGYTLDKNTLHPNRGSNYYGQPYHLAVTGEAFRWIIDFAPTELRHRMLVKGEIYARMSPDEKQELVTELQSIGYCVGFCGDGANDCGALKAGDIGISLSEAEASVAAPFTSNTMDINCVIDVIKEGRAALVTSFSCFKYMALYSLIQFTTVTLLYAFGSNLGDFQFLYIDLFLILPIAVYMGYTAAWPYLNPKRPTASLVSKKVLTSLLGQIAITSAFQCILFWAVHQQNWYVPPVFDPDGENIECFENTVLFLLSSFQYILIAVVFSVGPPYRQSLWTNGRLVLTITILVSLTVWFVLGPPDAVAQLMELETIPLGFRIFILGLAACNLIVSFVCEKYIFDLLAGCLSSTMGRMRGRRSGYAMVGKVHKKIYKRVLEEMGSVDRVQ